jgi:hypothetical protein
MGGVAREEAARPPQEPVARSVFIRQAPIPLAPLIPWSATRPFPDLQSQTRPSLHRGAYSSSPRTSPGSSTRRSQGYLASIPGRNLDGIVGCSSARTLGWNLTRYSARNRTRSSGRCSRSSGRSSGGSSRTSSLHHSLSSSSGRYFGSNADSYGGGIGGVRKGIGTRGLGLARLGCGLAVGGACAIKHIRTSSDER